MNTPTLYQLAERCLAESDADYKARLSKQTAEDWRGGRLSRAVDAEPVAALEPGRPERPELVASRQLGRRRTGSSAGRAMLYHALAHIEFNAINLAWDAIYRFRSMPADYYDDWVRVADEEACHFSLLQARLRELGHQYGDFPAHDGLWTMARKTAHDPLVRMALVPRTLEARGLDANPALRDKLSRAGDARGVEILDIILRDEIGHVAIGNRWYHHLCQQRGLDPQQTYIELLQQYFTASLRGPFHVEARLEAGFSADELQQLTELSSGQ
ncbi:MAG: ferritin-like domain-containing protein [Gammaproteobacteria bacterium]|nr:ferritin-like domain-containing protein [Gammaproteobacteria bacterium]